MGAAKASLRLTGSCGNGKLHISLCSSTTGQMGEKNESFAAFLHCQFKDNNLQTPLSFSHLIKHSALQSLYHNHIITNSPAGQEQVKQMSCVRMYKKTKNRKFE